ncbi:MAG: ribonuclease HII [Sporomusaceae bacterium]|nr:ribonuclease HII [Sporomusaceae bacterium]
MNITDLKITEISALLRQRELPQQLIDSLSGDRRSTVRRLLDAWLRQRQRRQQEDQRLQALYRYEASYYQQKLNLVAGVDEAGRGPLAGPVVVAAVILPENAYLPGLNDSKQLSAAQREVLYDRVRQTALAVCWQAVDVDIIDTINIYQATVKGMYQAVAGLEPGPQAVLIDAVKLQGLTVPWQAIVGGDALSASIAAASVIAKVERDRIMTELGSRYPGYGFEKHKGYATKEHLAALQDLGPSPAHRRSFEPVKSGGGLFGFENNYSRPAAT